MVNPVPGPVVSRIVTFARTFTLGVAGVIPDKSWAADQQVKQEAQHFHADGDEEEDQRVLLVIFDQQLGEDAGQRDDHPSRTWEGYVNDEGDEEGEEDDKVWQQELT